MRRRRAGWAGIWTLRPRNRQLLQLVFRFYDDKAAWPGVVELQHTVDRSGGDLDVAARLASMPASLGRLTGDGRIVLEVRALAYVPEAHDLLSGFFGAVRFAHRRYLGSEGGAPARVSNADLMAQLNFGTEQTERVWGLMVMQPRLFRSDRGLLAIDVQSAIRHFSGVQGAGDYLAAEAGLRRSLRAERGKPGGLRRRLGDRHPTILARVVIGVAILAIGAVLAWAATEVVGVGESERADAPAGAVDRPPGRPVSD